jgi:hypothetical protein
MNKHIVITGNPADGFAHYGPFDDPSVASDWADGQRFDWDYWVVEIISAPETTGG